jgi:hypothetical protein
MAHINAKTDRVYYVLQMNLKCDADEATNWIVGGSVKQDLIDLLAPMGAKFYKYMDGFNKLS